MTCGSVRSALADVALGEVATLEITEHLADCAACRADLEAQRALVSWIDGEIQASLALAPSPTFPYRARRRIAEAPRASVWRFALWLVPVAGLAGLFVALSARAPTAPSPSAAPAIVRNGPAPEPPPRAPGAPARVRRARPLPPTEPEVLVPPGEEEAVLRLAEAARRMDIDPDWRGAQDDLFAAVGLVSTNPAWLLFVPSDPEALSYSEPTTTLLLMTRSD